MVICNAGAARSIPPTRADPSEDAPNLERTLHRQSNRGAVNKVQP